MITWKELTDKGSRDHNEDSIGVGQFGDRLCFVLADGLGGHGKGEVASQLVVRTVLEDFERGYQRDTFLKSSLQHAQEELLKEQEMRNCPSEMKTTVVCLLIDGDYVQWAFAGDSRLYRLEKKKIKQRTIDHSVPQMLVLSREIKEKEIRFHEDRNRLLRVMGADYGREVFEISPAIERRENQQFLLCSDGFWELIVEKEMEKLLRKAGSVSEWVDAMQHIVMQNGAGKQMDNYSAIAVWC